VKRGSIELQSYTREMRAGYSLGLTSTPLVRMPAKCGRSSPWDPNSR
jgi:hypothetical protein